MEQKSGFIFFLRECPFSPLLPPPPSDLAVPPFRSILSQTVHCADWLVSAHTFGTPGSAGTIQCQRVVIGRQGNMADLLHRLAR